MPCQNSGIDKPNSDTIRAAPSTRVFRHTAATIPVDMPSAEPISMLSSVNSSVTGNRDRISWVTGVAVRNEAPRSPTATRRIHSQNCSGSG